ncbi:MAG: nucleoside triphosphate pyrophosphohydrolase [Patescibacteria group bacterium]|jgi:predicted house-cleaning noncanonical NTP pyrophosphatase (MazG superfamily)
MKKIYNKLVRDKILQICEDDGEVPEYYTCSQSKFKNELKRKLVEEAKEVERAPLAEIKNKIADVYEVLLNIAKIFKIKWSEVETYRKQKNQKRGSFDKKYFLVSSKK